MGKKFGDLLSFGTRWEKSLAIYLVLELSGKKVWQFIEFWNLVRKKFGDSLSFGSWWEKSLVIY